MTDEKPGSGRTSKAADTIKARVIRDYWPTEHETDRVRAGEIVEVSKDDLIDGLEKGILVRVKG